MSCFSLFLRQPVFVLTFSLGVFAVGSVWAAPPVVSNVRASQRAGTGLVDIYYDVADADGDRLGISAQVSTDGGATYTSSARTFSGPGYGLNIAPGRNLQIVWDAGADWDPSLFPRVRVKVIADDGYFAATPEMVYIPPGEFSMGDHQAAALPVHLVNVSGFFMDKFEVTKALWDEVRDWALAHGYTFDNAGAGAGPDHPAQTINWYDAVKWCNARSEMRGRTPVYYTDIAQTKVYRQGRADLSTDMVKWTGNGYRLPTEAEWEKAARGGLAGQHYPWFSLGNDYQSVINGSRANYTGSGDPFENKSPATTPVGYFNGKQTPAGVDMANGYGLYDMAGNVWEWCWDWYSADWYSQNGATLKDTKGPSAGQSRMLRGGSWINATGSGYLRCAFRVSYAPVNADYGIGFRCVRGF